MEDWSNRVEKKIDKIDERLNTISTTLVTQQVILDEHQKRSTMLEQKLEPLDSHVKMVQGIMKFLAAMALIATIWAAVRGHG